MKKWENEHARSMLLFIKFCKPVLVTTGLFSIACLKEWTVNDDQKWLNEKGFPEECELFRGLSILK